MCCFVPSPSDRSSPLSQAAAVLAELSTAPFPLVPRPALPPSPLQSCLAASQPPLGSGSWPELSRAVPRRGAGDCRDQSRARDCSSGSAVGDRVPAPRNVAGPARLIVWGQLCTPGSISHLPGLLAGVLVGPLAASGACTSPTPVPKAPKLQRGSSQGPCAAGDERGMRQPSPQGPAASCFIKSRGVAQRRGTRRETTQTGSLRPCRKQGEATAGSQLATPLPPPSCHGTAPRAPHAAS